MKTKIYKSVALSLFFGISFSIIAQNTLHCGTTEARQKLIAAHPEILQKEADYEKSIQQIIAHNKTQKSTTSVEPVYTIPLVFHIIHIGGPENISDAQIFDEVNILNRDYAKLNADTSKIFEPGYSPFDTLASNIHVRFRLARLDPNGNCTNGIDRIYSHKTINADDQSKLNQWPRDKYLNVWVVKSIGQAGAAGYAYYPSAVDGVGYPADGVLILSQYIGSIGTGSVYTSRALTHEIGHCFNLQHPWGNTNAPEVACGDDLVDDTPETEGHLTCDTLSINAGGNLSCTANPSTANYSFADVTTTSGTTDPTAVYDTLGLHTGAFSANGLSANSSTDSSFNFSNWSTGAADGETNYSSLTGSLNAGKYYQFTVNPQYAYYMKLTGLTFTVKRSATGPRTFAVRSSADGFTSNIAASILPADTNLSVQAGNTFFIKHDTSLSLLGSKITLSTTAIYYNNIYPVTFRIYAFNAEDTVGSFSVDNLAVLGSSFLLENLQNYMDYSYCSVMFTKGQKDRMRAALQSPVSGRNNLWTLANLNATGTNDSVPVPNCAPLVDFTANETVICAGRSVTFTSHLGNLQPATPVTYNWIFDGGSIPSSTSPSPTVTYNTPGIYAVKLMATTSGGTDSLVKTSYIKVNTSWANINYNSGVTDNFESSYLFYTNWIVENLDQNSHNWGYAPVGYNSSHSALMEGFENYPYDVDNLISPTYNLSYLTGGTLTFRLAGSTTALQADDLTEKLVLYSSTDCGVNWAIRHTYSGAALANNGYIGTWFSPSSANQWALETYNLPTSLEVGNVRFKFEYTSSAHSNNIYIDDININGTLGIEANELGNNSFTLFPNPTNENATIAYHLAQKSDTKIELMDVLGKVISKYQYSAQNEGDYDINISKQEFNLQSGVYFVRLTINNNTITKKLIITE